MNIATSVPHVWFRDAIDRQNFLDQIQIIGKTGTVTEYNHVAVFSYREKLQNKLIRQYQNPNRLLPDRNSIEYKQWRKAVFERDSYTCVECHEVGGRLNAHHIKSWADYPKLRFELSNGATLCEECHKLTDTYLWRYFKRGI